MIYLAGTDFSHLTTDELIKGIKALDLPDYIRSKAYGIDVRETLAQMTEMTIQLGANMGLSPDEALKWARKLQESVSQSEFDSWVATLLDGGPSIFMNTLNELKTAYPKGTSGVALVRETDPAKIYVWNGSSWEDFGDYQGIEIKDRAVTTGKVADYAITPNKISKIGNRVNYFNKDNVMTNQFYTGSIGNKAYVSTTTSYSSPTLPIIVKAGDIVRFNYARFTSYFLGVDDNDIIRQVPTNVGGTKTNATVTVDSGVTKFYTASHNNDLGTAMITINKEMPSNYFGYDDYEKARINWLKVDSENLVKQYQGKKWVAFGDSLTEANSRTTKNYHGYVADDLGLSVTNMGVGGTGYKRTSENNTAFYQRISNVPLDTEVITIFGSLNDLGAGVPIGTASDTGTDTLGGAINTTLDNLNSRLPVVPVGIISPTPWQTSKPWDDTNAATYYAKLLKDICEDRGLAFLDLYHSSGLRPWDANYRTLMYSRDGGNGTHPDENGHKLFYPQVRELIKSLI